MTGLGHAARVEAPLDVLQRLRVEFDLLPRLPPGLERHARLVDTLVEASEWVQGVLDAQAELDGRDEASPLSRLCGRLLLGLGMEVVRSLQYRFEDEPRPPQSVLERLARLPLPGRVRLEVPHGHAFHGLYPEQYAQAALGVQGPLRVVGLRGAGAGLGGVVAAATRSGPPFLLRPVGHHASRSLQLSSELSRSLVSEPRDARFAIVDEEPSGSAEGMVVEHLEAHGVPVDRIHVFGAHPRRRGDHLQRHLTPLEELFPSAGESVYALSSWLEPLTGRLLEPPRVRSGGAWREQLFTGKEAWPGVGVQSERRKLGFSCEKGRFVVEFAGLSRYGARALRLGAVLAGEGFVPRPLGLRHGFTVHPELTGARTLLEATSFDRRALLDQLARYLAFRANHLPAEPRESRATLEQLCGLARAKVAEAMGDAAARCVDGLRTEQLRHLGAVRPCCTDGKLQPWEWLVTPEGRLWKTDAVHHVAGEDGIGAQDVAWDLVGAEVELGLDGDELGRLVRQVEALCDRRFPPALLLLHRVPYLAFRLGQDTRSARSLEDCVPEESTRLLRQAAAYRRRLEPILAGL